MGRGAGSDEEQRLHGHMLLQCLRGLYSCCKLNATDFCVLCFYCLKAGVVGGSFAMYAEPPNQQTGKYQRRLDRVLPPPGVIYEAELVFSRRPQAICRACICM